jgi:hypothetical protein
MLSFFIHAAPVGGIGIDFDDVRALFDCLPLRAVQYMRGHEVARVAPLRLKIGEHRHVLALRLCERAVDAARAVGLACVREVQQQQHANQVNSHVRDPLRPTAIVAAPRRRCFPTHASTLRRLRPCAVPATLSTRSINQRGDWIMDKFTSTPYRTLRWYEWLLVLLLLMLAAGVRAAPVYKCIGADGSVAYQAWACTPAQQTFVIDLPRPPAVTPSPRYAIEREVRAAPVHAERAAHAEKQDDAYECRVSDGRVFYRLGGCPHAVSGDGSASKSHGGKHASGRGGSGSAAQQVTARRVSRDEACHQIHRAGAIGRNGHELDEAVSTYERDLGHDPCR